MGNAYFSENYSCLKSSQLYSILITLLMVIVYFNTKLLQEFYSYNLHFCMKKINSPHIKVRQQVSFEKCTNYKTGLFICLFI